MEEKMMKRVAQENTRNFDHNENAAPAARGSGGTIHAVTASRNMLGGGGIAVNSPCAQAAPLAMM
jgi:hypothetical protein